MLKEIVICEKPITAGGIKILPVVKMSLTCLQIKGNLSFNAVKQPEYVVVCRAGKIDIYNMSGEEVPISRAKSDCPGLESALAECYDFPLPLGWR